MIDLHTHSTASDGTFSPCAIVSAAEKAGLKAVALTDHDTVFGISEAVDAAKGKKIVFVPGIEISAEMDRGSLHIVGLYIDHRSKELEKTIGWLSEARNERNLKLIDKLNELGFPITMEEVAAVAGDGVVGRPHFAEVLVGRKLVKNFNAVFRQYLASGKPAYVHKQRLDKRRAIEAILSSGGVPILAHPDQTKMKGRHLENLIRELKGFGLLGMETHYTGYTRGVSDQYVHLAKKYALVMSGGSDFHGDIKPDIKLGVGLGNLHVPDDLLEPIVKAMERVRMGRGC